MKILFVCRANVGRSQTAEGLCRKIAPADWEVSSAGTRVVGADGTSRDGQRLADLPGAADVITVLAEEGVDASANIRRQLTSGMVADADRIVVMAEPETVPEYLKDSPKATWWTVPDPKETSLERHREIKDMIRELVAEFVKSF
mgnify:CR=1 FL=1